MLKGKTVLLGVTGGIAAYKSASLASMLVKSGANVRVIMTEHATNFINPITFETLTGHKCVTDTFDRNFEFQVEHISLAKEADVIMVAPATANVIAKLAHGLADDMLTTTILASNAPKLIAPAMNTGMYDNPVTQRHSFRLVVGNVDKCGVDFLAKLDDFRTHLVAELCIQIGQRLIHQQNLGLANNRAANGHTLPLATGQSLGLATQILSNIQCFRCFTDPAINFILGVLA